MSEMNDTLENWSNSTGFQDFINIVSWQAVALLVIFAAAGLVVFFKKDKVKKENTIDVSKGFYIYFIIVVGGIGLILAIQNGAYGYSLGDTLFSMCLTAGLFFLADLAYAGTCYLFLPYRAALALGVVSLVGLFCLSSFAGLSWIMGKQHVKDNFMFNANLAQIARYDTQISKLSVKDKWNSRDALREIKALEDDNKDIVTDQGGYTSEGTAVYKEIAKHVDYNKDEISISTRTLWAIVLVMFVTSGGGLLPHFRVKKKLKT